MKILKVSLENLNSLRGRYDIDLENGPLARAGIFAITGPTGAGKSTILDAITLALYGRAARYAKGPDDMMSRHTGKCRAEVEFSVKGVRFRASWHLQKAHGKAHGKLQDAQRRVFDADGVTLAQNKTQADTEIERLTGLNYERFLRSVLLAQGEFARFLKADADERADLLEQLTGTEIYSRLSLRAHTERARLEGDLAVDERAQDAVVLLTEAERAERAAEITRFGEELATGAGALDALNHRLDLGRQLCARQEETRQIAAREAAFAPRRAAAQTNFARLDRHRQAQPFCADLARLDAALARAAGEHRAWLEAQGHARTATLTLAGARAVAGSLARTEITICEQELTRLRAEEAAAAAQFAILQEWLERHTAERTLENVLPALSASLALLIEGRRQQEELRRKGDAITDREKTLYAQRATALDKLREASAELTQRQAVTEKLAADLARLLGADSLGAIQDDLRRQHEHRALLTRLSVLLQKNIDSAAGERSLGEKEASLAAQLPAQREQAERARDELAVRGRLVEALQDNLAQAQLIASFEDRRAQLAAGQPCPLCGSGHHPYAGPAAELPAGIEAAHARLIQGRQEMKVSERIYRDKEETLTRMSEQHRATAEQRLGLRREHEAARQDFTAQAGQHGVALTEPADLQAEIDEAAGCIVRTGERIAAIQTLKSAHDNAVRVYDDSRVRAGKWEEAANTVARDLTRIGQERAAHASETAAQEEKLAGLARELHALLEPFGETSPAPGKEASLRRTMEGRRDEHARQVRAAASVTFTLQQLGHAISQAQAEAQRARVEAEEFAGADPSLAGEGDEKWTSFALARERVREMVSVQAASIATEADRHSNYRATSRQVDADTAALRERLTEASGPFADLADLRAARLSDAEVEGIERAQRALETEANGLLWERRRLEQDIAGLCEKQAPEEDALPALEHACDQQKAANAVVLAQRARVEEDIRRDDETRALREHRAEAIERARDQLRYWRWLHELIGSHDGGKFRRFAQGLTLDLLVRHANRHLARLSERYRLQRAEGAELSLNVVDQYQAGSLRPITSLSGGESFLTSLALALGLSDLAGRNVRIDSLFVDEGFGSLDADTLDIAVAALDTLRTSDKMIGIISHVELLKERISTQIRVEKMPGGVSSITVVG